eukprot:GHVS01002813.1.p1 GENE.GHVS01002813.1~~GHVS01002813.1.p1  ORF type:complete len:209 (+),score=23.72 GHVS01002813.1:217-843(+)
MMLTNAGFLALLFWQMRASGIPSAKSYNDKIPLYAWWMRSDSIEASCGFLWVAFQLVNAAFVFSFGGMFRRHVFDNKALTVIWLLLNSLLVWLVISPPSLFTCFFRVNCTDEIARSLSLPGKWLAGLSAATSGSSMNSINKHNVMSTAWRVKFLAITWMNVIANISIAKYIAYVTRYLHTTTKSKMNNGNNNSTSALMTSTTTTSLPF